MYSKVWKLVREPEGTETTEVKGRRLLTFPLKSVILDVSSCTYYWLFLDFKRCQENLIDMFKYLRLRLIQILMSFENVWIWKNTARLPNNLLHIPTYLQWKIIFQ